MEDENLSLFSKYEGEDESYIKWGIKLSEGEGGDVGDGGGGPEDSISMDLFWVAVSILSLLLLM